MSLMFGRKPGRMGTQAPRRYALHIFILVFVVNVFTAKMLIKTNIKQLVLSPCYNNSKDPPPTAYFCKRKGKAVPLQTWSGPEGSMKLRFPDFVTTAQDGGKVVSLTH